MCLANASHRLPIYIYNPLLAEMKEIARPKCGPTYILGFGFHPGKAQIDRFTYIPRGQLFIEHPRLLLFTINILIIPKYMSEISVIVNVKNPTNFCQLTN